MNEYPETIPWSRLARFKGKERRKVVNDRTYTRAEIKKMLEHADLRMKVIILTLVSTGMRTGGLADLRLKDLTYIENYKIYKMVVYSDSPSDTYYTFCTPECAFMIQLYLDYRQTTFDETLTGDSPLIRQKFDSVQDTKMTSEDVQERVRILLMNIGFTNKRNKKPQNLTAEQLIEKKRKRNAVMRCHGFRKYFNNFCIESEMNIVSKELLIGHKKNLGLDIHYYRPTSDKLLEEYLEVVNDLTINDEHRLKLENQNLKSTLDQFKNFGQELAELKKYLGMD